MKKAILLAVCALFIGAAAFAQSEEKKPTKEETIKWLTEKLPPLLFDGFKHEETASIETIDECNITIIRKIQQWGENGYVKIIFPTNFSKIYSHNDVFYNMKYDFPSITIIRNKDGKLTTDDTLRAEVEFLDITTSEEAVKRVEKAIRHLSTFCNNGDDLF